MRERGRQRAQGIHPVAGRELPHEAEHAVGQLAGRGELRVQVAMLLLTTGLPVQAAVPQQVADLLEGRVARQVVDVVAAVREHAAGAIEVADGRGRGDQRIGIWPRANCRWVASRRFNEGTSHAAP